MPQMPAASPPGVDVLGVASMHAPEQNGERIEPFRDHDGMDMIGHQRIGEHPDPGTAQVAAEQAEVHFAITIKEEDSWRSVPL